MIFFAGDIGGTKTLFALYELQGEDLTEIRRKKFSSKDHATFDEIVEEFLNEGSEKPDSACFGIAGPIEGGVCKTTNLPWEINAEKLSKKFSIPAVKLINDLEANAWGIQTLGPEQLFTLNQGKALKGENQGLISAGTGLGEALIFCNESSFTPSSSEGGHCDFSPRDELEIELLRYLWLKFGHASYERVLSGQGLVNIYQFLIDSKHEEAEPHVIKRMETEDSGKVISDLGLSGESKACKRALQWFCSLYGAEAGNFALKALALGGLYIGGGIAPKILDMLKRDDFMKAFTNKGRFSGLLKNIPVYVVLDAEAALKGSAYYCKTHTS